MKLLAVIMTVITVLSFLAMFAAFFGGTWSSGELSENLAQSGVILMFATFITGGASALLWASVDES